MAATISPNRRQEEPCSVTPHIGVLLAIIIPLWIMGLVPIVAVAEPVVFYCEVKPDTKEAFFAVDEGVISLAQKWGGAGLMIAENTARIIKASGHIGQESDIPPQVVDQIDIWKDVMKFDRSLGEVPADFFAASKWNNVKIDLGAIVLGETIERRITLAVTSLTGEMIEDFFIEQTFEERPDITFTSHLEKGIQPESSLSLVVSAWISEDADLEGGEIFIGDLALQTSNERFNRKKFSMEVVFQVSLPRVSEVSAEPGRKWAVYLWLAAGITLLAAGAVFMLRYTSTEPKARVKGKLVLTQDPTHGESGISVIDLQLAAHASKEQLLILGSGPEADIQLPHKSVKPRHCSIFPVIEKGVTNIYISPLEKCSVMVNNKKLARGAYLLQSETQIGIGKFGLDFELTDLYRQVEIWTLDGSVRRGVITHAWDIDAPGFSIVLFVDKFSLAPPPSFHFEFSDVKAIKFYRGHDRIRIRQKLSLSEYFLKEAIVHFRDDSMLECRLPKGVHEGSKQIFALPPRGGKDVDYYVVVGENVSRIEMT